MMLMTKKAYAELKKRRPAELEKDLLAVRLELVKLNAQVANGAAAKEAGKIKNLKKKVARINTLLAAGHS
jgi:ribosomal protein L29